MNRTPFLLAGLALVLAGCAAPDEAHGGHGSGARDTGEIVPGGSATLRFDAAGAFEIHCHPHPFMAHHVTVADDGPAEAHVHIHDGSEAGEYRFEPANLTVGRGATVTYHNHGALTHTATEA